MAESRLDRITNAAKSAGGETWRVEDGGTGPRGVYTGQITEVCRYPMLPTNRSTMRIAHIAAADPQTVLALVTAVRAAQTYDEAMSRPADRGADGLGYVIDFKPQQAALRNLRDALAVFQDEA